MSLMKTYGVQLPGRGVFCEDRLISILSVGKNFQKADLDSDRVALVILEAPGTACPVSTGYQTDSFWGCEGW